MKYVKHCDYDYIINKYHDTKKPFNPHARFIRHDEIFDANTGMQGDDIIKGINEQDEKIIGLPHSVRKAKALDYVLKNTRISCDNRDIFPAVNMVDRPLARTVVGKWRWWVFNKDIPDVEKKRAQLERDGIVTIWPDYDHSVPVWSRLFSLGFPGIVEESEKIRYSKERNADEDAFFEGIKLSYEAVISFIGRLEELAKNTSGSEKMAKALGNIKKNPPKTFYEALLLSYIYFIVSEHVDNLQVRSLSGFDKEFYGFYKNDLANGVSEDEIRHDLAYYFLQFTAIGNYWNQPLYLGGEYADGSTVINELSYLVLDVYNEMNIYCPKIQIKVSESTPKDILMKALDMIRSGRSSIVFVSDATIRRALERVGATKDEARECHITGCYEYSPQSSYDAGMNYINMMKPLEYALHEGCDGVTGVFSGSESPALCEYKKFEDLYSEYKRQLLVLIDAVVETVNGFEKYLCHINPLSLLSGTFPSALEKAKDAIGGGGVCNNSIALFGYIADITDSLMMIKKYVYEKNELTLEEFVKILDSNYEGNENFRKKLLLDREKYGNNKERPDAIAVDLVNFITENLCGRPNAREGEWNCGFHVSRMSYIQGKATASSPNGRLLGQELSKNVSASMGQNREGATAAVLSATKIDASSFICSAALDLGLLPSAVKGDDGLESMYALLMTFVRRGGHAMQINVFDADTLRDAQANPDKYRDLQIRVAGWNVLWNNINKEEQDGFIRQAEALV
ncbi:MAG: hypothetical protein E7626_03190 [Ruminococcaceae bacterium]|nr:hypothetical protein [Oscillospiraceae bacterium]